MARHPGRYYKNISLLIKLAIVVLAFGFIYKQVFYRADRAELYTQLDSLLNDPPLLLLALSILLMFFNWSIEAWKWKLLVSKSENVSLWNAFKAVLSGVTIGAFTPNRFGEFAGRIFYLQRTDHVDGILMTFAGSAAQLLVTVIGGCIAWPLINRGTDMYPGGEDEATFYFIAAMLVLLTVFLLIIFFFIPAFASHFKRVKIFRKYEANIDVLYRYTRPELIKVFMLSLARYAVFSFQFYLLLLVYKIDIPLTQALAAISLSFLIVAIVPSVALAELGIRGSAALACIGMFSSDHIGIIAASFTLWIINIALPAIAGAFFVFGLKFFREKS